MATKRDIELARAAGAAVLTEPGHRMTVEACPFAEGTEERTAWLDGFHDALDEQPDPAELKRNISAARGGNK